MFEFFKWYGMAEVAIPSWMILEYLDAREGE
jgi:hypothetical protein